MPSLLDRALAATRESRRIAFRRSFDAASANDWSEIVRDIVAMANSGPNSNTSQFFIMHSDYRLPPSYVIFGRVTKGIEVVDALVDLPMSMGTDGDRSKPATPVVMKMVTIRP